ncbi:MAG: two-component system response regulator OmpR, partial [Pseudonocardia sp.]|nr:two-component system response regulator OmpR [Pseudonocardia sp.]
MAARSRVLVVDDDRALRDALVRVLDHAGFAAAAVADGE